MVARNHFHYMAVSHKDWELPNSWISLAKMDIDRYWSRFSHLDWHLDQFTLGARGFFFCFVLRRQWAAKPAIVNERKKNPLVTAGMNLTSMLIGDKTVCQTGFMWDLFVFVIWHVCARHSIMGVTGLHDSYVCDICTFAVYDILY